MSTPNGESFNELYSRATGFLDDLQNRLTRNAQRRKQTPQLAVIVTHSGVLRCLHAHVNGLSRTEAFHFSPPYGSVIRLA
jgi:broad specificity phosphatase PhoE